MSLSNNNNHHKNCGFAEETVAYLYGETEANKSAKFEAHLAKCEMCADELASFTTLRAGIKDWKNEFDKIPTPFFEIPYQTPARTIETEKISFFDSLKNLLSFSPALAGVAAAVVFALFVGLGFLIFNSNNQEFADEQKTIQNNVPEIAEEKPAADEKEEIREIPAPEVADNEPNAPENVQENAEIPAPENIGRKSAEKPRPVAIAKDSPKPSKKDAPKPKTNNPKSIEQNLTVQAQKPPKLNTLPEDEETEELRLSDLLADLDAK